jgi:hypothetical protein
MYNIAMQRISTYLIYHTKLYSTGVQIPPLSEKGLEEIKAECTTSD